MGYDGKKVAEINRLRAVGGHEVKKFWQKNDRLLFVIAVAIFLSVIFFFFEMVEMASKESQEQQEQKQDQTGGEKIPRFVPPFLNLQPAPPHQLPWQKRDGITPVHWSSHHGNRHHDRHYYSHFRYRP